jgi:serine/threonine-protein kinase
VAVSDGGKNELETRASGRVGQIIKGKYRLERVLGIGGMATVYAATHRNQKRVAMKMLHAELSYLDDVRARFLREGYVANTVGHPGALEVLDEDVAEDGAAFLVMELLDGKPLDVLADEKANRVSVAVALAVADQLLDVLAAAHAKTIVHRDIKPANLFVTREGTLKVLDFGIARLRDATRSDATGTGVVLGTPAFMAPEQAYGRNEQIDAQTDLFAVGATMFKILAGKSVHGGGTASEILIRAATSPAPPIATVRDGLDPRVAAVIDKALAFEKGQRWEAASAMRAAVRQVSLDLGLAIGKDVLAELIADGGAVSTAAVSGVAPAPFPPSGHDLPRPLDPTRPTGPARPLPPVLSQGAVTGGSTASPITTSALPAKRSVVGPALLGSGLAFALAAVAAIGILRSSRGRSEPSSSASPSAVAPSATAIAPLVNSASPTSPPSPASPSAIPPPASALPPAPAVSSPGTPSTVSQSQPSPPASHAVDLPKSSLSHAPPAPSAIAKPKKPNDDDLFHP